MSATPRDQALRWIAEQIDRMGEIRNANTRDPGFREWRQNTMTCLQRIWPGDGARSGRFRRVPFAPPSARATDQEARECYERGFAEARQLLKMWETEIRTGVAPTDSVVEPVEDLRPKPERAAAKSSRKTAGTPTKSKRGRPQLRDLLGFSDWSPDVQDLGAASREEAADAPPSQPARPARPARERRSAPRSAPPAPTNHVPAPRPNAAHPARAAAAAPTAVAPAPAAGRPPALDTLALSISDAIERARRDEPEEPPPTSDFRIEHGFEGRIAAPVLPPISPAEVRFASRLGGDTSEADAPPPGQDIAALGGELERVGVPEADRTRLGIALAGLAKTIESGRVSWPVLREGMTLMMAHPGLARRGVPLLLRYFDSAA